MDNLMTSEGEDLIDGFRMRVWDIRGDRENKGGLPLEGPEAYSLQELMELRDGIIEDFDLIKKIKADLYQILDNHEEREVLIQTAESEYDRRMWEETEARAEELYENRAWDLERARERLQEERAEIKARTEKVNEVLAAVPHLTVLQDVLIDLELDVSPAEIAAKLRQRFNLVIQFKEW